ncbi:MAG: flagellar hook assembly protein FlgD, partial [Aeromonas sobria]
ARGSQLPETTTTILSNQGAVMARDAVAPSTHVAASYNSSTNGSRSTGNVSSSGADEGAAAELSNMFLDLMLAQIKYQDPTNPLDSSEYVSQLAQFSQVESLEMMRAGQEALYTVSENQLVMSTANLVGREVTVPYEDVELVTGQPRQGELVLDKDYDNVTIKLFDEFDNEVGVLSLGGQQAGTVPFELDCEALGVADGNYRLEAETVIGEEVGTTDTYLRGMVSSVTLKGVNGMQLEVAGLGSVPLFDITQIRNVSPNQPARAKNSDEEVLQ